MKIWIFAEFPGHIALKPLIWRTHEENIKWRSSFQVHSYEISCLYSTPFRNCGRFSDEDFFAKFRRTLKGIVAETIHLVQSRRKRKMKISLSIQIMWNLNSLLPAVPELRHFFSAPFLTRFKLKTAQLKVQIQNNASWMLQSEFALQNTRSSNPIVGI